MPTSPLKRPSAGGRLGRLLASLRPPTSARPLPVQTGFPTSLADLVVKHHVRLKHPRKRRPTAAPSFAAPAVAISDAEPPPQQQQQRREGLVVEDAVVRPKAAAFSIRPELLMVAGAVALALLVIWSKTLVAAATLLSVALFWIESVRSSTSRRLRPAEIKELDLCGRGPVSPIREAESAADTPRPSCDGSDKGSEVSSVWAVDSRDLGGDGDDSIAPKRKGKRRSLRKLIAKKLHSGKRSKDQDSPGSPPGCEIKNPDAGEAGVDVGPVNTEALLVAPAEQTTRAEEATTGEKCRRVGALPLAAFIPVILVGLIAGTLPAVALTVLCTVFFSSVERVPGS